MTLPPYAELLGLVAETDDNGAPVLLMPFSSAVLGRPGFLHGGAMGGLMEMAAILALRHALGDADVAIKPVNLTVDYMRGGRELETRARGQVRRLGSRVANVDALCWQDDATRPIASARLTFLLRR